ncbi:MAG: tetratricopeptide repeat protein [Bacteroidales bacterium]|nr:tetratricopeptide repeat protein [Bacteroidales bacterium]
MKKIFFFSLLLVAGLSLMAQNSNSITVSCSAPLYATADDSIKCQEEITTFRMALDARNYADAYTAWQNAVTNCPCTWQGLWAKAQTMFDNLIRAEKDSLHKETLIDSMLWVYEVRHQYMPKIYTEGNSLGNKAYYTMRYRSKNYNQAMEWFIKAADMEKENLQAHIWDVYFKTAEAMVKKTKDTTLIINAYEQATEYIGQAIVNSYKKYEKVLPNFDNLKEALDKEQIDIVEYDKRLKRLSTDTANAMKSIVQYKNTLSNIEGKFTPYAPCHVLEAVYGKKLEANRDNLTALKKIILTMSKGGCLTSPVFIEALSIVHEAEPSAQSAYLMGNLSFKNNDIDKAITYFTEAIPLYETNEQRVEPYYMLGLCYLVKSEFSKAREAAQNAIKINQNCGKAYILIGDLYAQSSTRCSGGDAVPYDYNWAAADKYSRAASVDASVAAEANAKRAKLHFPSKQDAFVRGLNPGDSYRVGCWINESTTVRVQ